MIGKTISHYKILEKIGEGGMGDVYLAEDMTLERQVAIKFLPKHLSDDNENVERFKREAKAAASLNHPNIVTIHDIIEENDQICIVMEYLEGKSLRDVISSHFQIPSTLFHNYVTDYLKRIRQILYIGILNRKIY